MATQDDDTKEVVEEEVKVEETPDEPVEEKEEVEEEPKEEEEEEVEVAVRSKSEEAVDYGEDIDPDDVKTIGTIVEKQTASLRKQMQDDRDRYEVDTFIKDNPKFEKYKPAILKHLQHEVYSRIPVKNIATMLAGDDLLKMGATKEREAQAKANATKSPGDTARPSGGEVDYSRMPLKDFELEIQRAKGMQV